MKRYIVVEGFVVAGKSGGEEIKEMEIDRADVLLASGRIIPVSAKTSDKLKTRNPDTSQEDDI